MPEIIIFLGALVSIVSGAFFNNNKYNKVFILSIITLIISFIFILYSDVDNNAASKLFVNSYFTNLIKLFTICISVTILYVSNGYIKNNNLNLFEYPILLLFAVLGMFIFL